MSSRIDAVAARVDGAIRMNQVSRSMGNIVKGMDRAMQAMDMQKVCLFSRHRCADEWMLGMATLLPLPPPPAAASSVAVLVLTAADHHDYGQI